MDVSWTNVQPLIWIKYNFYSLLWIKLQYKNDVINKTLSENVSELGEVHN